MSTLLNEAIARIFGAINFRWLLMRHDVRFPPTSCHEPGQCTVPKAVERLCPGHEKFLPFSKRPKAVMRAKAALRPHCGPLTKQLSFPIAVVRYPLAANLNFYIGLDMFHVF